jgi:hypothetical protein
MESLSIDKKQKLMGNYSFILPEDMRPYQYAIYEDDLPRLFDYMKSVFDSSVEGEEKGYFTLSFSVANSLHYYGFVTEMSNYYDPNIFVDDPDDPFIDIDDFDEDDEPMYTAQKKIITKNENRFDRWYDRQVEKGYDVKVRIVNGYWYAVAEKN